MGLYWHFPAGRPLPESLTFLGSSWWLAYQSPVGVQPVSQPRPSAANFEQNSFLQMLLEKDFSFALDSLLAWIWVPLLHLSPDLDHTRLFFQRDKTNLANYEGRQKKKNVHRMREFCMNQGASANCIGTFSPMNPLLVSWHRHLLDMQVEKRTRGLSLLRHMCNPSDFCLPKASKCSKNLQDVCKVAWKLHMATQMLSNVYSNRQMYPNTFLAFKTPKTSKTT